ncbi:univin-like [Diorhabda carinulata]|uniref:univin-like n=1 Tax=Diorhabda carinulata TaxID=1163345 RepID=UPI0025A1728B|nr:univin-like [Diorhabda carinulata]
MFSPFTIAFAKTATADIAREGSRSTGIYLLDKSIFPDIDFMPVEITEEYLGADLDDEGQDFIQFQTLFPSEKFRLKGNDPGKINISLDEYTRMMNIYLQSREKSGQDESVPKLVTFKLDRKLVRDNDRYPTVRLRFPVAPQGNVELESAELKLLVPPQFEDVPSPKVQVNVILGNRRKELIRERTFYLSQEGPKWCTVDITSAVQSWLRGDVNLGLELVCLDSNCRLDPLEAAVTSLIHTPQSRRVRRESPYEPKHKTTCKDTGPKHKCCRQSMNVTFSELGLEQEQIVRPQVYDAGYCTGMCPPNYLHSYNHTYIQSIMRRKERRNHKAYRKVIPKACCAPLKLSSVSFLVIDPDYPTTMVMRLWENMAVEECGCS